MSLSTLLVECPTQRLYLNICWVNKGYKTRNGILDITNTRARKIIKKYRVRKIL